jgi:hypothetical protein
MLSCLLLLLVVAVPEQLRSGLEKRQRELKPGFSMR